MSVLSSGRNPDNQAIVLEVSPDGNVQFPDANDLFNGEFARKGFHLEVSGPDGQGYLVRDYFLQQGFVDLLAPNGAILSGEHAGMLAGPRMPGIAQAPKQAVGASPGLVPGIGQVEKVTGGTATATRADGTKVQLAPGQPVRQGDIIETAAGTELVIIFTDRTVLNLDGNSRMVLDQYTFTAPDASSNSMLFTALQGAFVFLTGFVAPSGSMKINTPVATMGVRGTIAGLEVQANGGVTDIDTRPQPNKNGAVGTVEVKRLGTDEILTTVADPTVKIRITDSSGAFQRLKKTLPELQEELKDTAEISVTSTEVNTRLGNDTSPKKLFDSPPPGASPQNQQPGSDGNQQGPSDGKGQQPGGDQKSGPQPQQKGDNTTGDQPGTQQADAAGSEAAAVVAVADIGTFDVSSSTESLTGSTTDAVDGSSADSTTSGTTTTGGGVGSSGIVDLLGDTSSDSGETTGETGASDISTTEPTASDSPDVGSGSSGDPPPLPSPPAPPSITVTLPAAPTVTEDGSVAITGISISDSSGADLTVDISAFSSISFATVDGLTFATASLDGVPYAIPPGPGPGEQIDLAEFSGSPDAVADALATLTYSPTINDDQSGGFNLTVSNGETTTEVTLTVPIDPVDDPPVATDDAFVTTENVPVSGNVLANDSDPDTGDILNATVVGGPANSNLSLNSADGSFVYTPAANFVGTDTFSYVASDGALSSFVAEVTITVTPVNDPPALAGDLAASVLEGGTVVVTTADLGFVDPDDGAADVTFTVSNQVNGSVLVNGLAATTFTGQDVIDGLVAFAHDGSNTTTATFDVSVEDGDEDVSDPTPATFNLTVTPVNDPPTIAGDLAASVLEGGTVVVTTADLNFVDPDDGPADV
ncbi:MAG: cadherin-like domain-containing protein, partial [Pseudomonadota bacterium]